MNGYAIYIYIYIYISLKKIMSSMLCKIKFGASKFCQIEGTLYFHHVIIFISLFLFFATSNVQEQLR